MLEKEIIYIADLDQDVDDVVAAHYLHNEGVLKCVVCDPYPKSEDGLKRKDILESLGVQVLKKMPPVAKYVFVGGAFMAWVFNAIGMENNTMAQMPWYEHLVLGGFCFGAVFMATDPVTSARTERGKYIFGFLIGVMAIVIRVLNPGYPEGMMLAILLMNIFAPLIDYCVVQSNISRREKRAVKSNQ